MNKWAVTYSEYGAVYVDWYYSDTLEYALWQYQEYPRRPRTNQASLIKVERI